ncbi:glycosyltransferase family 39 protein [Candidatus Woesearchaeota archaeon]|nr:glycosyltransferase family 39 protein [Candidatus Woesearchaeota archaeon]
MTGDSKDKTSEEITVNLAFLKKLNWKIVLLFLFLVLGVYLRCYHLNFPAIGYHNMKENEIMDQAVFFMNEGNFLHKQAFAFFGFDEGNAYHEEYGQAPLVPYMLFVLWSFFGKSLWLSRLLMILFFMGAIFVTYALTKKLSKNEYLSLLTAGLMTIMPLGIYFGRNVQVEPPALFFMVLAMFFYVRWIDEEKRKDIFYTALFLGISALLKYTFMIAAIPMLFIFPYKKFIHSFLKERKQAMKDILYVVYGFIPMIIGVVVFEFLTMTNPSNRNYDFLFFRIFTPEYWSPRLPAVMSYINDNYSMLIFYIAIIGLLLSVLKFKTRFGKFMVGYSLAIIPYISAISSKFAGHSYYQMPFLPLICMLVAYVFFITGSILKQSTGSKWSFYFPLIILLFAIPSMQAANDRVFGTVFYGQDFLGEYLKTQMYPGERFAAFTHSQDLATCSYSEHRCGFVTNITEFRRKEEFFDLRYVYVGAISVNDLVNGQDPLWQHIRQNYGIEMAGFMPYNGQLTPSHFVLKKGSVFDLRDLEGKQPSLAKNYDTKLGEVPYYFILVQKS